MRNSQCTDDHRRAVNTVFTILDTLETWADEEVEARVKQEAAAAANSSRASKKSRKGADAAEQEGVGSWPCDEGIERIQAISSKITLQLRADAAIRVGAHARAVKYLEMHSRLQVADELFGNDDDGDTDDEDALLNGGGGQGRGRPDRGRAGAGGEGGRGQDADAAGGFE